MALLLLLLLLFLLLLLLGFFLKDNKYWSFPCAPFTSNYHCFVKDTLLVNFSDVTSPTCFIMKSEISHGSSVDPLMDRCGSHMRMLPTAAKTKEMVADFQRDTGQPYRVVLKGEEIELGGPVQVPRLHHWQAGPVRQLPGPAAEGQPAFVFLKEWAWDGGSSSKQQAWIRT